MSRINAFLPISLLAVLAACIQPAITYEPGPTAPNRLPIRAVVWVLKDQSPDLFLVPMAMRDGRTCYQIFFGSFGSEAAAKEAARKLPTLFHAEGNRPKPFRAAQIVDRQ